MWILTQQEENKGEHMKEGQPGGGGILLNNGFFFKGMHNGLSHISFTNRLYVWVWVCVFVCELCLYIPVGT